MYKRIIRHIVIPFFRILPALKCNSIKIFLLNQIGHKLDKSVVFASSAKIMGNFTAHIGKNTFIGHNTLITGGESDIYIGDNCDISSNVSLVMGSHEIDVLGSRSAGKGISKSIFIDNGVWIGYGSIVLPGITIGKKAIIGAGSVVNKDIPPYCIAAGNPCKPIKIWNSELNTFEPVTKRDV